MCSKTCHLVNAPLITQVKTTALGALDPSLVARFFLATETPHLVFLFFLGLFFCVCVVKRDSRNAPAWPPKQSDVTPHGAHLGIGGNLNMTRRSGISL